MIAALFNLYLGLLYVLVKMRIVSWNAFWMLSPVIWLCLLLVGLFIPMGWGAPSGPVLLVRDSVQIVPNVAGEVVDVPVEANTPLKAGSVLFRIDPAPFRAKVDRIASQLKFAELRHGQMSHLYSQNAGRAFDVEQRETEVEQLRAELEGAQWDLEKTTVRAPADGYVTNVALRKGARVASLPMAPVMAFIDTSETTIGIVVPQIYARYVAPGQEAEVTFKYFPGKVFAGRVLSVLQAVASGQVKPSGLAVDPGAIEAEPFVVKMKLDDPGIAGRLPAGSTGVAAVYTEQATFAHAIRRVILRQVAILNYVLP